jgi:hypothetical protein
MNSFILHCKIYEFICKINEFCILNEFFSKGRVMLVVPLLNSSISIFVWRSSCVSDLAQTDSTFHWYGNSETDFCDKVNSFVAKHFSPLSRIPNYSPNYSGVIIKMTLKSHLPNLIRPLFGVMHCARFSSFDAIHCHWMVNLSRQQ